MHSSNHFPVTAPRVHLHLTDYNYHLTMGPRYRHQALRAAIAQWGISAVLKRLIQLQNYRKKGGGLRSLNEDVQFVKRLQTREKTVNN